MSIRSDISATPAAGGGMPTAGGPLSARARRHRRVTWATLALSATVPAAYALGLALVVGPLALLIGWLTTPILGLALLALWSGLAPIMLVPAISDALLGWILGVQVPAGAERARMSAAWARVCLRAGVAPERFSLRLDPSGQINAFAAGLRMVALTGGAMRLHQDELEAVLAHELGHHRDCHTLWWALASWYLAPLSLVERLLGALARLAGPLPLLGHLVHSVRALVGWLVRGLMLPAGLVWALGSRRAEYDADASSRELGYGRALVRLLERIERIEQGRDPWTTGGAFVARRGDGLVAALLASHPPTGDRIRRLEARLGRRRRPV